MNLPLEKQVVSLELAQKLKELGVPQESFFKWGNVTTKEGVFWDLYVPPECNKIPHPDLWVHGISAFTVAELGEVIKKASAVDIHVSFMAVTGGVTSRTETIRLMLDIETLTKMLIYLLENHLITLD